MRNEKNILNHMQSISNISKKNNNVLKIALLLIIGASVVFMSGLFFLEIKGSSLLPLNKVVAKENMKKNAEFGTSNSGVDVPECKDLLADELFGNGKYLIHIHKGAFKLELFSKGNPEAILVYDCAIAKNSGDKQMTGDNKTPTTWGNVLSVYKKYAGAGKGVPSSKVPFRVEEICDAHTWSHDFHDGKGVIPNAYGPWFISLDTGWDGIGIHGTHAPESIGHQVSEGCIRLKNENVAELKKIICVPENNNGIGTGVIIIE